MSIQSIFPILKWLPHYNQQDLKGDVNAGLTVGIMLIPQGMAYAMLAGLPPIYGLYASIVPQLIYALMGTSRQLGVGPVAMDSLLVAVTVSQLAQAGSDAYIALAILLAFLVGAIQLLMGVLRLGFLVNFLSHPVISGFTSAAALIIGFSQLKYLLGVDLERSQFLHEILWDAALHLSAINPYTLMIGLLGILIIIGSKKIHTALPAPLLVVVFGILVVGLFKLDTMGVAIVQEVPSGLPAFGMPTLSWELISQLLSSAFTIALIAFMEAIAVAKAIQVRHKDYQIDPNQELLALGAANLVGSFFQSFPGTGGFSRSAVNDQAGAKTNLAAIISALFVMLTLLLLTPLFYYLPKAVLASIIMVAVFKLIAVQDALDLWKQGYKRDFLILVITFLATLGIGIQSGILVGVLLSIMGTLYDTMTPTLTTNFSAPTTLTIHYKGLLYYANSHSFKEKMEGMLYHKKDIQQLVIDGSSLTKMDSTGQKALEEVVNSYKNKGIEVQLVNLPSSFSTL